MSVAGYQNKKVWVKVEPWNKDMVTTALEGGADGVMLATEGNAEKVKALGIITVIAPDGDLILHKDAEEVVIASKEDEFKIIEAARTKITIVSTKDWTIIPLENIVAQTGNVFMEARTLEEAKTFLGILEKGVDGIVIHTTDVKTVKQILKALKEAPSRVNLSKAVIKKIAPLGMGDRICVDTCSMLEIGEGMLVGNSSASMFLVHSESVENPYVQPRPFRVNAGPVHAYVRVPGDKTRYLSELKAGDTVLVANYKGEIREAVVGRIKRERRPLIYVEAICEDKTINTILQNAETIRLTSPQGAPVSVVELKEGDEILVALESAGRHFGHKVQETIAEI
jgi:3-dehydroquinate synthase II